MLGFVNSAPGFNDQPRVINGAADLFVELLRRPGQAHARGHRLPGVSAAARRSRSS